MGNCNIPARTRAPKDAVIPTSHQTKITDKYILGRELGRGEFGITYLCTDRESREALACKSISKRKLRTAVDVEDVRREVSIMSTLPDHPNVVKLRATYEDGEACIWSWSSAKAASFSTGSSRGALHGACGCGSCEDDR
ncbi:hypothetical protein Bca52824_076429 [Brassica carinata]|uniref:Protein kinase domain-containing protein n=1 Tax=Brassica carinata TaxID=52824 RepID=A0A8X7PT39_BRACI|nr:hypothetical protein Bca52824_076429 [Brassica carinata]